MNIKLAIHHRPSSFSDRWIQYCLDHRIDYEIVNCYDSDIIHQIKKFDVLMWHWVFNEPKDQLIARQVIASIENMGIKVFPNLATCWHYDDKIGQKYLLESIGAPLVPTYVFSEKEEAIVWIDKTEFPKVFKLRCGAGSQNVQLVETKKEAKKLCEIAFGKGFSAVSGYFADTKHKVRSIKTIEQVIEKLKRMPNVILDSSKKKQLLPRQKGNIYFQEYLPDNVCDTRVVVIGNRAFAKKRGNRKNDFRASGSGLLDYNPEAIDIAMIKIAFTISKQLKFQSMAYDFLYDYNKKPKICEISFGFPSGRLSLFDCPGHWDDNLNWHKGHMWPEDAILLDLLNEISSKEEESYKVL